MLTSEAMMTPSVSRRNRGFPSPLRHPRFVIGGSGLGALLVLELAASFLMAGLT
ncbi:MAG: hypothetical protein ACAH11_06475 [Sphingomonas sp.]